jgi:hypothetical protein
VATTQTPARHCAADPPRITGVRTSAECTSLGCARPEGIRGNLAFSRAPTQRGVRASHSKQRANRQWRRLQMRPHPFRTIWRPPKRPLSSPQHTSRNGSCPGRDHNTAAAAPEHARVAAPRANATRWGCRTLQAHHRTGADR